tara:strand:- start:95 stop:292 length:198 start_codon:yes stop_codon:yes gene_type:complete
MDEFIFLNPEENDEYQQNHHINSHNSLHPSSKPLIIDRHLDKALKNADIRLFEETIELWKIYGES